MLHGGRISYIMHVNDSSVYQTPGLMLQARNTRGKKRVGAGHCGVVKSIPNTHVLRFEDRPGCVICTFAN